MSQTVTIDELAAMIQEGFMHVDGRFAQMDSRLDVLAQHLDRIERTLLADHERRIARLEDALAVPSRR